MHKSSSQEAKRLSVNLADGVQEKLLLWRKTEIEKTALQLDYYGLRKKRDENKIKRKVTYEI